MARANRANSIAYQPALEKIANFDINWNIVAYPNPSWAKQVFPDDPEDGRGRQARRRDLRRLAGRSSTIRSPPGRAQRGAAQAHQLAERPALPRAALHRAGHRPHHRARRRPRVGWRRLDRQERHHLQLRTSRPRKCSPRRMPGASTAMSSSTKPLSHQGTLIDNIEVRFEGGRIVEAQGLARRGGAEQGARHRRGRAPARRGGAGAAFLADLEERAAVLQHAVRRERRLPHRARPVLFEMLRRRRAADATSRSPRRAATRASSISTG